MMDGMFKSQKRQLTMRSKLYDEMCNCLRLFSVSWYNLTKKYRMMHRSNANTIANTDITAIKAELSKQDSKYNKTEIFIIIQRMDFFKMFKTEM